MTVLFDDNIKCIMNYDCNAAAYKIYCQVSVQWRKCAAELMSGADIVLCNQIQTLVKLYPCAQWDWITLSRHCKIDLLFIRDNLLPFDKLSIAKNPNVTWIDIDCSKRDGNFNCVANIFVGYNVNMTYEQYVANYSYGGTHAQYYYILCNVVGAKIMPPILNDIRYIPYTMSDCRALTWEIVLANPDAEWNYDAVACQPLITAKIICENTDKFKLEYAIGKPDWTWNMTAEIFVQNIRKICNYSNYGKYNYCCNYESSFMNMICMHHAITWEIVETNPNIPWSYRGLSANPNITFEFMQSRPDLPWVWSAASRNPNITWNIISANRNIKWSRRMLARNPNITWKIIRDNQYFGWNFRAIAKYAFGGAGIVGKY